MQVIHVKHAMQVIQVMQVTRVMQVMQVLHYMCLTNALPLTNLGLLNPELSLIWVMLVPACTLTLCALCQFS